MTKIDIVSGFLGAGKTTFIKKMIGEAYGGEKLVLIENEFGEIGIDGGFLQDAGIQITEMNSGCICCSLVGDFGRALADVLEQFKPDRILIEPSGVGKLSDVMRAVQGVCRDDIVLNSYTTIVDAGKCKMYIKNFGEFFCDQVEHAGTVILSHTDKLNEEKIAACVAMLREHNADATIITTPWHLLTGMQILAAMERKDTLSSALQKMEEEHHHHCEDEHCACHHHEHHHDDCHEHHHHHDEEPCHCHEHEHGQEEHHHHHHHADEVFGSFGKETTRRYTKEEIGAILDKFANETEYGMVLRAKGIVAGEGDTWIHFDYVPGEADVRTGAPGVIGRLCVIGSALDKAALGQLFGIV